MSRALCLAFSLVFISACATTGERLPLKPLPDDEGAALPYAELLTRARVQATAATEAFYVNKWADLEEAAKGLEQTARFLGKAADVPPNQKDKLPVVAGDLAKEAVKLREAAKAQDVEKVQEIQQRVHLKVRELRLDG